MQTLKGELIYKSDARRAILKTEPRVAFCIDNIKPADFASCVECGTDNLLPCKYCRECGAKMDLTKITEQAKDALTKMGEKAHGDENGFEG